MNAGLASSAMALDDETIEKAGIPWDDHDSMLATLTDNSRRQALIAYTAANVYIRGNISNYFSRVFTELYQFHTYPFKLRSGRNLKKTEVQYRYGQLCFEVSFCTCNNAYLTATCPAEP